MRGRRRWIAALLSLGVLLGVAGCTMPSTPTTPGAASAGPTAFPGAGPAAATSPRPYELATAPSEASAADATAWAARVMPSPHAAGYLGGRFGWLSADTLPRMHTDASMLRGGRYTFTFACMGSGGMDYAITGGDGSQVARGGVACDGALHSLEVTVPARGGVSGDLGMQSGPIAYAIAVTSAR